MQARGATFRRHMQALASSMVEAGTWESLRSTFRAQVRVLELYQSSVEREGEAINLCFQSVVG